MIIAQKQWCCARADHAAYAFNQSARVLIVDAFEYQNMHFTRKVRTSYLQGTWF